jgi:hypothetical protein
MIWKILLWIPQLLFWGALAWIIFGLFGNRRPARVLNGDRIEFAPHWIYIWAWLYIIGFMAWSAASSFLQSQGSSWIYLCFGLAALEILSDYPATIIATEEGIEQIYWFHRHKHICWKDIVEIETGLKERAVTIVGLDGTKIVHSTMLASRSRLLLELKQHCSENLPPDFPREAIEGS